MCNISEVFEFFPSMTTNPSQHVIMLRTDILNRRSDKQFMNTVLAFQKYGYKVTIVTSTRNSELDLNNLSTLPLIQAGSWIPRNIFGYFTFLLYIIRTIYIAACCVVFAPSPKPSVVFCNASCVALPICSLLKPGALIHFQNPCELMTICKFQTKKHLCLISWALKKALLYANEIFFPDPVLKTLFQNVCVQTDVKLHVCYPCVDVQFMNIKNIVEWWHLVPGMNRDGFLFVAYGNFLSETNHELALDSFLEAMETLPWKIASKMHLAIGGIYNEELQEEQKQYNDLYQKTVYSKYGNHVTLLKNIDLQQKKSLFSHALAILHTSNNNNYSDSIFEAMLMGKVVIATDTSFAKEVIEHKVNGFMLPAVTKQFAAVIQICVIDKIVPLYMANVARREFKRKYSFYRYANLLNQAIVQKSFNFCCPFHCTEHENEECVRFK